ncbi:MAG: S9 family peptidase [Porticoccaceae bacterium]|jgi:dipeptidyl aminopeptidase/acylaminoacyl peptidase|nr:S9 family peptidase [Porticoccaceae bacterium]
MNTSFYQYLILLLFSTIFQTEIVSAAEYPNDKVDIKPYGLLPKYRSFAFSPNSKHFAFIQRENNIDLFVVMNAGTQAVSAAFRAGTYKARNVYFATDKHVIIVGSKTQKHYQVRGKWENSKAFVYNIETQKLTTLLDNSCVERSQSKIKRCKSRTSSLFPGQSGLGRIIGLNKKSREVYMPAYSGLRKPHYDVYRVSLKTGKAKRFATGNASTIDWFLNEDGTVLAREDFSERTGEHLIYSKTSGEWELIYRNEADIPEFSPQAISQDNKRLFFTSFNENVFSMALDTGEITGPLFGQEGKDVGFIVTDINRKMESIRYSGFTPSYSFPDQKDNETYKMLSEYYPASSVYVEDRSTDNNKWLVHITGNDGAGDYRILDREKVKLQKILAEYPDIAAIGEIRAINYKARDGLKIPAILTLPTDPEKRKNLPLIALPHGGPASHDTVRFDWLAQYLTAKGYAVLQPNFRGSTGFGYELKNSGDGEWGKKMQDDVSDGIKILVKSGYVDPDRVCIMGASYGGYSALAGGAFSPELYRCVISIAGVSDLPLMISKTKSQNKSYSPIVKYWERLIGDPETEKEKLKSISPVNFAENFQAPVLLIHGKDDLVVPIIQSKRMLSALKKVDKVVELITLKGEDHWLSSSETRLALLQEVDRFLEQHNPAGTL